MDTIKKILVPIDFTVTSRGALKCAMEFIKKDKITLQFLYTTATPINSEETKTMNKKFKEFIQDLRVDSKVKYEFLIASGPLVPTILKIKESNGADLIIMGTKGSTLSEEMTVSNTVDLVLEADCPVLVIPVGTIDFSVKKIALAIGKNEIDDSSALQVLLDVARCFNAEVHVLTVDPDLTGYSKVDEKNENILEYYLENFYAHHSFPEETDIEKGIFDYVKNKDIDMLAILPRNHSKNGKPSEGRLTKLLTMHTKVPLLTID
ncbi:universal stress protein [Sungkyunkwania multivorans]|uniref:Universal stress protein n=1 Tax=Sungkyunkwania multivorans TaxID=1173618 RepID=A0ABW3CW61_9FLAO